MYDVTCSSKKIITSSLIIIELFKVTKISFYSLVVNSIHNKMAYKM